MEELLQKARTQLTFIILGLGIFFTIISLLMSGLEPTTLTVWMIAFLQNLAAGFIGAFVVLWIVEKNLSSLQSLAQKQQEKDSLIFRMSNPNDNAAALEALRLLRQNNHVTDGSLRGKKLDWAMLQGANLMNIDKQDR